MGANGQRQVVMNPMFQASLQMMQALATTEAGARAILEGRQHEVALQASRLVLAAEAAFAEAVRSHVAIARPQIVPPG